jgi:hypothetical protein
VSNIDTHRLLHGLFNDRQFDRMAEHLREDLHYSDEPREMSMRSRDAFFDWLRDWTTAFSDARVADAEYLDGGDFTVCRFQARGTQDGQMGPLAPTGERMDLPFCEILHWTSDGLMETGEVYYDQLTLLSQLGHLKPPQGL